MGSNRNQSGQISEPNYDFSSLRIAFDHLTASQGVSPEQSATLATMFFVGLVKRDQGEEAARAVVMTALEKLDMLPSETGGS